MSEIVVDNYQTFSNDTHIARIQTSSKYYFWSLGTVSYFVEQTLLVTPFTHTFPTIPFLPIFTTQKTMKSTLRNINPELNNILFKNYKIMKNIFKKNLPSKSLTSAKVITSEATNRSAIAKDAKNKFPILRKLLSVYIAMHTRIFPAIDRNISVVRRNPVKIKKNNSIILFLKSWSQ